MALDSTPEVVEEVVDLTEQPEVVTEPEVDEPKVGEPDKADEPDKVEGEPDKADEDEAKKTDEPKTDEAPEPVTFDTTADVETIKEQGKDVIAKYDLEADAPDLHAYITALETKASAANEDVLGEYSVYGDADDVKSLLDRQSLLYAQKTDDKGTIRPKTDEFAAEIVKTNPETAAWLHFDLSAQESPRYKGYNNWQASIADALALPGDTMSAILTRYDQFMSYMKEGALPANDIPTFIPKELHQAYGQLPKETREELAAYAPSEDRVEMGDDGKAKNLDAPLRERKLAELRLIQDGIDARGQQSQLRTYQEQQNAIAFNADIQTKQEAFFDTFRQTFAQDVTTQVKFSDDPKMQTMLASQNVALLEQAFDPTSAGEFARKAITEAGIPFDNAKAQSLLKEVEVASVALVTADRARDPQGELLDKTAYNKATGDFEKVGRKWQAFAKETLDHLTRLTSTGTAEAVKKEVEKIKLAPKARAVPKGIGTQAKKEDVIPAYQSPEWYDRLAKKDMEAEERRARVYA